jgi:hypothetical protein
VTTVQAGRSGFRIPVEARVVSALSQNCEKRLLASPCLSVRLHGTARLPLDGFS